MKIKKNQFLTQSHACITAQKTGYCGKYVRSASQTFPSKANCFKQAISQSIIFVGLDLFWGGLLQSKPVVQSMYMYVRCVFYIHVDFIKFICIKVFFSKLDINHILQFPWINHTLGVHIYPSAGLGMQKNLDIYCIRYS